MVRDGMFDDVDVVVTWHPGDRNAASAGSTLANVGAKFKFHGISAHAAAAPDKGRSALDAVEAMDNMVNMMREHIPSDARVHYVITDGGKAPNVVPDVAEVYYVARHNDMRVLDDIWERIVNAAKGAALGTGTTMEVDVISAVWNVLPNEYLARLLQKNLERVGGVSYTAGRQCVRREASENAHWLGAAGVGGGDGDSVSWLRCAERVDGHGRRELARADGAVECRDVGPRHTRAFVAGGCRRRDGYRCEGDDGRREDDDVDGDGSVHRSATHREGARGLRESARARTSSTTTRLAGRKPALDYRK
jgi:hypothetical protein